MTHDHADVTILTPWQTAKILSSTQCCTTLSASSLAGTSVPWGSAGRCFETTLLATRPSASTMIRSFSAMANLTRLLPGSQLVTWTSKEVVSFISRIVRLRLPCTNAANKCPGNSLGQQIEDEFTEKAKASGLSEEEAKYAFNQNMMSTGFLAEGPAGFGREYKRRWLVTGYEAGDLVLHKPHMIHASTINHDPQNKIRVGTDLRFVDSSRSYDKRWTNHYTFEDGV